MKNKKRVTGLMALLFSLLMLASSASAENMNSAYWTDAVTSERLEQLDILPGQERIIRLRAEIPSGSTLKAYSFKIGYNTKVLEAKIVNSSSDSEFPPMNIDTTTPGKFGINSFDIDGIEGPVTFTLIDVKVKGIASGKSDMSLSFSAYGTAADNEFLPRILPLQVNIN